MTKKLLILYFAVLLGFFVYSYSQIDLNLTLYSNPTYLHFQSILIELGYFNRPLSTFIFCLLLTLLSLFYILFLRRCAKGKIPLKEVWKIIICSYTILLFSYPAFSHDIFNYLFDARIVTKYQLSPYYFTALDFPHDQWIRFMHWTHRYFPYGPLWLGFSLVPSYIGFGKFVLTLFLFKLLFNFSTLGSAWGIVKIASYKKSENVALALVYFALNPLILIEGLVSPHNEISMFVFTILGFILLLRRKRIFSILLFLVGVGIKFLPIVFLPFVFIKKSLLEHRRFFDVVALISIIITLPVVLFREPYPWYFIPFIGFASLAHERLLKIVGIGLSIGLLLRYAPYLYYGDYQPPVAVIQAIVLIVPIFISAMIFFLFRKKITL